MRGVRAVPSIGNLLAKKPTKALFEICKPTLKSPKTQSGQAGLGLCGDSGQLLSDCGRKILCDQVRTGDCCPDDDRVSARLDRRGCLARALVASLGHYRNIDRRRQTFTSCKSGSEILGLPST